MRDYATAREAASEDLLGSEALDKVKHLLGQFQSAMMVTPLGNHLRVRPMAPMGKSDAFTGTLWFFADDRGRRTGDLAEYQQASLIFQDDRAGLYLHLIGRTLPVPPRDSTADLPDMLPHGLDEPYLMLLRFDADRGYFWESPGGMLRGLGAFPKPAAHGAPPPSGHAGATPM